MAEISVSVTDFGVTLAVMYPAVCSNTHTTILYPPETLCPQLKTSHFGFT